VIGGACSKQGRNEKWIQRFEQKIWKGETICNAPGVDGIILKFTYLKYTGDEAYKNDNRAKWRDLVVTLMNLRVTRKARNI
jgi:hypothetical protein